MAWPPYALGGVGHGPQPAGGVGRAEEEVRESLGRVVGLGRRAQEEG